MAISDLDVKSQTEGNGVTVNFAIPFSYQDEDEVEVWLRDETDPDDITEELLVEGALQDYTLTGATPPTTPLSTTVTMNAAPIADTFVHIRRVVPMTQPTTLVGARTMNLRLAESVWDRIVMQVQQAWEAVLRAPKFQKTYTGSVPEFTEVVAEAILSYSEDGTKIVPGPSVSEIEGYAATATAAAAASAAEAAASAAAAAAAAADAATVAASVVDAAADAAAAATSAAAAAVSALAAAASATAAAASATSATASATSATASATSATASATSATASAAAAAASAAAALVSENNAETAETNAAASAAAAATDAATAATAATAVTAIGPEVTGTRAAPSAIVAGIGVAFVGTKWFNTWFIHGSGGNVTISANPRVAAGTNVGQKLTLIVPSTAVNSVSIADGNGMDLNGPWVGDPGRSLDLEWDGTNWFELGRR